MYTFPTEGLALACDGDGAVRSWMRDDFGLNATPDQPVNFLRLLHESNQLKGLTFLAHLRQHTVLVDWELCFCMEDKLRVLRVAAVHEAGTSLLLAANSTEALKSLCREFGTLHGTFTAACKQMLSAWGPVDAPAHDAQLSDDFMRMYNDFARLQREYAAQKAQLKRAGLERERLMNMAVHDLRSPLGVITLLAGSLGQQARKRLSERELSLLDKIIDTAREMSRSLGEFLDSARHAPGVPNVQLEPGDLARLAQDRVDLLAPLAQRKQIILKFQKEMELPVVKFDKRRMQHVIDNLLGNALKFSPSKTTVEVFVSQVDTGLQLAVYDQGPGVPDSDCEKIFEAYVQGAARPTGDEASNGLGLAICRSLVQAQQGKIWVENRPEGGAAFCVFLPGVDASVPLH